MVWNGMKNFLEIGKFLKNNIIYLKGEGQIYVLTPLLIQWLGLFCVWKRNILKIVNSLRVMSFLIITVRLKLIICCRYDKKTQGINVFALGFRVRVSLTILTHCRNIRLSSFICCHLHTKFSKATCSLHWSYYNMHLWTIHTHL